MELRCDLVQDSPKTGKHLSKRIQAAIPGCCLAWTYKRASIQSGVQSGYIIIFTWYMYICHMYICCIYGPVPGCQGRGTPHMGLSAQHRRERPAWYVPFSLETGHVPCARRMTTSCFKLFSACRCPLTAAPFVLRLRRRSRPRGSCRAWLEVLLDGIEHVARRRAGGVGLKQPNRDSKTCMTRVDLL